MGIETQTFSLKIVDQTLMERMKMDGRVWVAAGGTWVEMDGGGRTFVTAEPPVPDPNSNREQKKIGKN